MSTSSHSPPNEPTDEQLGRLRRAVSTHAPFLLSAAEIYNQTLERLDESQLVALVLEEGGGNPLVWCENHPGAITNVRLTISVEDGDGWANAVALRGTLQRIPDDKIPKRSSAAESSSLLSSMIASSVAGAALASELVLNASGSPGGAADEIAEFDLDVSESTFELQLAELPPGLRLATAEVQSMPSAGSIFATGTEIWPAIAQRLNSMSPAELPTEVGIEPQLRTPRRDHNFSGDPSGDSLKVPRTLHADSRDSSEAFLATQNADSTVRVSLTNDARIEVSVNTSAVESTLPLVAEVMYKSESGCAAHRYLLNDLSESKSAAELTLCQQLRIPANAVDPEITLNIRGMSADEICILPNSMRRKLFSSDAALCGLTIRETGTASWELSVFRSDLLCLPEGSVTPALIRVAERPGGVE